MGQEKFEMVFECDLSEEVSGS